MIEIDLTNIINILGELGQSPIKAGWELFKLGGWIPVLFIFLLFLRFSWLMSRIKKYLAKQSYVLLAIDIPKNNEQTPKAVEHIFAHLAGAHSSLNFVDIWWEGKVQESFSLEIVSINGYVQFFIRTNVKFRDLVEAAIYAQYPDAQIMEVADYTENVPYKYPNEEWDLWGTEFILVKDQAYPIRTYPQFEYGLTGEFADPMAAFLENMSKLKNGEQIWFQIVITPIGQKDWVKAGQKVVSKLIGEPVKHEKTFLETALDPIFGILKAFWEEIMGPIGAVSAGDSGSGDGPNKVMHLTPGQKRVVEAVEMKLSKIGYETKIRSLYIAKKEVFHKPRGAHSVIGSIKQFFSIDCNNLKPELDIVGTTGGLIFSKMRLKAKQNKIIKAFKARDNEAGMGPGKVMNIEELASLYHFPAMGVKAPLVKKTASKRAEPPAYLPVEEQADSFVIASRNVPAEEKEEMPFNLPIEE